MNDLTLLTTGEKEQLYKLPAYISLLAARHDGSIDKKEQAAAIKLSHIKTYACNPVLASFFTKADTVFAENITQLNDALPKDLHAREQAIKKEIRKLYRIIDRLNAAYATAMRHGMQSFASHVAKAHNNVFEYFLFPMPIKGITE